MADPEYFSYPMTGTNHLYSSCDDIASSNETRVKQRPKSEPSPGEDPVTISIFQQNTDPPFMTNSEEYYYPADLLKTSWLSKASTNARYKMSDVFGYQKVSLDIGDAPAVLLGNIYYPRNDSPMYPISRFGNLSARLGPKEFLRDFTNIIWVTYRSGFRPINRVGEKNVKTLTTDAGWGCTIRVGQMMLLNTLKRHFYAQNNFSLLETIQENLMTAPFSVHKITDIGSDFNKVPGDWYSPSTICHSIEKLLKNSSIPGFKTKVFMDSVIYIDQLFKEVSDSPMEEFECEESKNIDECLACSERYKNYSWDNGILIMIPIMLGLKVIQEEYYSAVKYFLSMPQSVGIIGGKPRSALYFVGWQMDDLIFLDPHLVQKVCKSGENLRKNQKSYTCSSPKLLPINEAESSMSLGFYIRNKQDWLLFETSIVAESEKIKGLISIKTHTPLYCREDYELPVQSEGDDYIIL